MKKERNSNFELMRIISMLFIVYWHLNIFGDIHYNMIQNESVEEVFKFLKFIFVVHVNSFVLITGYFSWNKKAKVNKIFYLIQQSLFYKVSIMIILALIGFKTFTGVDIIRNLFPLELTTDNGYWFLRIYLFRHRHHLKLPLSDIRKPMQK